MCGGVKVREEVALQKGSVLLFTHGISLVERNDTAEMERLCKGRSGLVMGSIFVSWAFYKSILAEFFLQRMWKLLCSSSSSQMHNLAF